MGIPTDHLRACPEHGVVAETSDECPCCETSVEARPDAYDSTVSQLDLRWQIEPDVLIELIRVMRPYLAEKDQGPMWVTVAELPETDLAAGYTVQEKWFNVLQYEWGSMQKTICQNEDAKETIATLRENGYEEEHVNAE